MKAARWRRDDARSTRLLVVDASTRTVQDRVVGDLGAMLRRGDLLVVNDAATLPASLAGATASGERVEARLTGRNDDGTWRAVVFGQGDWRSKTEEREAPPPFEVGETLSFDGLAATIRAVDADSRRLVTLDFGRLDAAFWRSLYRAGRPIQYAYTARPFALWDVQTVYASRPWAIEAPSAGFSLTWEIILDLRSRGIEIARVTHAAGISSTGDGALDARLPFSERFEVSEAAARAVREAKARGGRVIALGTTVARALETAARLGRGTCISSSGVTDLLLGPTVRLAAVDAILSGVHEPGTSHYRLLEAFAAPDLLDQAHTYAEAAGYLGHEFGDAVLIIAERRGRTEIYEPRPATDYGLEPAGVSG